MKTTFLPLFLVGAVLLAATPRVVLAADTAPRAQQTARMERMKAALEKLDLTDAQKAQIKQIRDTTTDRRERMTQIMAVLTPDQKAKLKQMIQEHRNANGGAPATT